MGRFVQILLQPLNDMNTDGDLTVFHFGIEGWVEEMRSAHGKTYQGYRIVSQRTIDNVIGQIVEIMPDGWMPSKIYRQDVSFIKNNTDPKLSFREADVGCWNRRMIDINTEEVLEETPVQQQRQPASGEPVRKSLLGRPPSQQRPQNPGHVRQGLQQQPRQQQHPRPSLRHHKQQLLIALSPLPDQQTSSKRR